MCFNEFKPEGNGLEVIGDQMYHFFDQTHTMGFNLVNSGLKMALEFAPLGITSNCIQAGVTLTKSFQKIPNAEQIEQHTEKRNPFNRLTAPEYVAKVVSLLADDKANWINGCVIPVDGGERLR